ncbi:MAG: nuclear transport factor 2 family protein [Mycobacterium sp.]
MTVAALKAMFEQMVAHKNAELITEFYDPGFVMYSNGIEQTYDAYETEHRKVYATDITYSFEYDEQAWVENVDTDGTGKVAGRVWITTALPDQEPTRIEVLLIVGYLRGRILRVWELTYPNWAELAAFDAYET